MSTTLFLKTFFKVFWMKKKNRFLLSKNYLIKVVISFLKLINHSSEDYLKFQWHQVK